MEITKDCPKCNQRKLRENTDTGLFICYCGYKGKRQVVGISYKKPIEEWKINPPTSWKLSDSSREYLKLRLQIPREAELPILPGPVSETKEGILFTFPNSPFWQVRRSKTSDCSKVTSLNRWFCPLGLKQGGIAPYPYEAFTPSGDSLVVVEGVLDALSLWLIGIPSLAILTTQPRFELIEPYKDRFSRCYWMPDSDVDTSTIMRGLDVIRLVFPKALGITLPPGMDPNSLDKSVLKRIIMDAT